MARCSRYFRLSPDPFVRTGQPSDLTLQGRHEDRMLQVSSVSRRTVRVASSSLASPVSTSFARPKSSIFTRPSSATTIFDGFSLAIVKILAFQTNTQDPNPAILGRISSRTRLQYTLCIFMVVTPQIERAARRDGESWPPWFPRSTCAFDCSRGAVYSYIIPLLTIFIGQCIGNI